MEKERDTEKNTHVRINRKLRRVSALDELFIADSTYASVFLHHAPMRQVSAAIKFYTFVHQLSATRYTRSLAVVMPMI